MRYMNRPTVLDQKNERCFLGVRWMAMLPTSSGCRFTFREDSMLSSTEAAESGSAQCATGCHLKVEKNYTFFV